METNVDERYITTHAIPRVGVEGQEKIKKAKVLLVGVGGLGAPIAIYLAGQGVNTLGLVDNDVVMASNLHRQVLYTTDEIGEPKVERAKERLKALNPHVKFATYNTRLNTDNVDEIIEDQDYDIIVGATDNFISKFVLSEAAFRHKKTFVIGSVVEMFGEVSRFKPHTDKTLPCYHCVYPQIPPVGEQVLSSDIGILGSAAGIVGAYMATEILKEIVGIDHGLHQMQTFDFARNEGKPLTIVKSDTCPFCS